MKENNNNEEALSALKINLHGKILDIEGISQSGTNYIPVRFLENLGYEISWKNNIISIEYRGAK